MLIFSRMATAMPMMPAAAEQVVKVASHAVMGNHATKATPAARITLYVSTSQNRHELARTSEGNDAVQGEANRVVVVVRQRQQEDTQADQHGVANGEGTHGLQLLDSKYKRKVWNRRGKIKQRELYCREPRLQTKCNPSQTGVGRAAR